MWLSVKVSNIFNNLTLKQIFWKTKTFFKKLDYCFLVGTTKIESTSFPFKSAPSEANVKTNRMATTKWTSTKSGVLPVTTLFFLKICSSLRTSSPRTNVHVRIFRKRWSLILGCFFPVNILKIWHKTFIPIVNTKHLWKLE